MQERTNLDKLTILSKSAIFSQMTPEELWKLARFAKVKQVGAKKVIFHKAQVGSQLFALIKGRVKISTLSHEGKEIVFSILEPGEMFGEISLLDGSKRTATITAINASELLVIERRDFVPFLKSYPNCAIKLLEVLSRRLRTTDELIEDTMFLNLPARLAKKLVALAENYGVQTENRIKINLKLSQRELGNLVNSSRESVNKQMRAWESEGIITVDQGHISIKLDEMEKLAKVCAIC